MSKLVLELVILYYDINWEFHSCPKHRFSVWNLNRGIMGTHAFLVGNPHRTFFAI